MDYLVKFIGHMREDVRPSGFPYQVENSMIVRADTIGNLIREIEKQAQVFLTIQGMVAQKDDTKPMVIQQQGSETEELLDKRIFIPMSSISYMETVTKRLTNDVGGESERILQ